MTTLKNKLWVEKYRPKIIDEYVFQDSRHKLFIKQAIAEKNIPHLLLSGVQGTGKTSLSLLLVKELDVDPNDVLLINASDENSVQVIRDKVNGFISTVPNGEFKIIQLEEMDMLSLNGQAALKHIMEEYATYARFILTCNTPHKVIAPIKSRCQHLDFKAPDKNQMALRIFEILKQEHINFKPSVLGEYIDVCYPDFRKTIQTVQQNCINGELISARNVEENDDYKFKLLDYITTDSWQQARKVLCEQVGDSEWESVYKFLYENLHKSEKFSNEKNMGNWEQGILIINDHLCKDMLVADREINACAMIIKLGNV